MRAVMRLRRFIRIATVVVRHTLMHVVGHSLAGWPKLAIRLPGWDLSGPERVRVAFEEIGGTFIKFGQMLATQSDLIPLPYCRALFALFDRVPPFAYTAVERIFLEDLQKIPAEIFDHFDPEPIATGSVAQVHVAVLGPRTVAVKVRRPTVLRDFATDIGFMQSVVRAVKLARIKSLYWIIAPTEEFIKWTADELDFRREARYMDELHRNARDNIFEKIPIVLGDLTTARILTAEFLEGQTISEHLRQRTLGAAPPVSGFAPAVFAGRLIDNFLGDAFRHGIFHADLHPGNLMIMPGNVVGYIDFGISGVLSRYSRRHLISMTLAYARGDLDGMCDSFFRITTFDENADPQGFYAGLREISTAWYKDRRGQRSLCESITSIMLQLLLLSREHGIWPQRDVIKYIRSAIALDGLIKTLVPGMDIGRHLQQSCERHMQADLLKKLISQETLGEAFAGYANLLCDGFLRLAAVAQHAGADTRLSPSLVMRRRKSKKARRGTPWHIAWIGICVALVLLPEHRMAVSHLQIISVFIAAAIPLVARRAVRLAHVT